MPFKNVEGLWKPVYPKAKLGELISVGDWNIGPGGGRFIPPIRSVLNLAQKAALIKAAGATHMEFHDTEALPKDALEIVKVVGEAGLGIAMCTANLFRRPEFVCGNFGHPNPGIRDAAIKYTEEYIAVGIETFGAWVYVYWNGSNGVNVPLGTDYLGVYEHTAECITEIVRWMIRTYGPERALPFCIEPKPNEPRGWGVPADVGEALAIIAMLPDDVRPFVGLNPETCHSLMNGKRYGMDLGLAKAAGKLFHVHLNGGSGPKFDEDLAFGDNDITVALETMHTLRRANYKGFLGIDVQPMPTDRDDQQAASIERSIRNIKRGLDLADAIDAVVLKEHQFAGDQAEISELVANVITGS